ncbi:MAG: hypothetical protein AB1472_03925, partial [Candidatus Omnitrophota bacterium]
ASDKIHSQQDIIKKLNILERSDLLKISQKIFTKDNIRLALIGKIDKQRQENLTKMIKNAF